jgi:hypothetical protein
MKKGLGILSFLLLWTTLLLAQKFTSSASKTNVGMGEQFEVDFSVNAEGNRFTPPDFTGFQVLSGPNESTSFTSVNGNNSMSTVYSYILAATKEGTFTITAAAIVINGHTLITDPLKIRVKGQAPPQQAQQQQAQAQPADPTADDKVSPDDMKSIGKQLFLKAEVDKTHAFVGEKVTVSYKIYTRLAVGGLQADKAPDLNGFWNQDINNKNQNTTTETYNGLKYTVAILKQTVLFPEHAGDLTIDPLVMTMMVRVPFKGLFDNPFGNFKDVKYQAKSAALIVHAMPLPAEGKPANFSGAVGTFTVRTDVDKRALKANETLNYTFEVAGNGNLNLINAPALNPPADFDKYDPKSTDRITVDQNGVSGTRQFSYLLIPRHQGDYAFNPVNFSYFNPVTKKYITLPTQAFHIKVDKGDAQANVPVFNSSDQQDIKMLDKDIRYIKTSALDLYRDGDGFYNSAGYYILLLLGPGIFAGALFYRRWMKKENSDLVKLKSKKANKIAAKHLADAQKQLTAGNKNAFYEAIAKGLYGYLSDKLNIPVADLNKENITDKLNAKSVDDTTIRQLDDTIDLCEMARFAPVSGISQQEVFEKAKNIINEIEDKI